MPAGTPAAARLLNLRVNDALRNSRPLPAEAATYFWNPGPGGGAVILAADGTCLFADSSIAWDRHLDDFISGARSRPDGRQLTAA